jgi:hypothetical protein
VYKKLYLYQIFYFVFYFDPSNAALQQAETIFKQKLPANSFDSQFKISGFLNKN